MMPHVLTRSLDRSATVFLIVVAAVGVLIPLSNLLLPAGSLLQVPTYLVALFGKYTCYAILALAIDLIWGYCGILSLGHGAFFALGGYAMGMYLMRQIRDEGQYRVNMPDFGCGLKRMIFAPNSVVSASLAQVVIFESLQRWLGTVITVSDVKARAIEERLEIRIAYVLKSRMERRYLNLEVTL